MKPLTKVQQELYDWLVLYIQEHQHPPSIRQMMEAMHLRSPAPVQSRLEHLRAKGYIDWTKGQARTLRLLHQPEPGLPVLGAIAAGTLTDPFTESVERFDLSGLFLQPGFFALRVTGDSMIDAMILEGDVAIMQPVTDPKQIKNGTIVAARVEGNGTTLKHFHRKGGVVTLKPANPKYTPIKVDAHSLEVQGVLVGVWRGYSREWS
ncbi:transcriptional repressor LexA [Trichothermofontia sp.]